MRTRTGNAIPSRHPRRRISAWRHLPGAGALFGAWRWRQTFTSKEAHGAGLCCGWRLDTLPACSGTFIRSRRFRPLIACVGLTSMAMDSRSLSTYPSSDSALRHRISRVGLRLHGSRFQTKSSEGGVCRTAARLGSHDWSISRLAWSTASWCPTGMAMVAMSC